MEKLTTSEIQDKLLTVPDWGLTDGNWIQRKFRFTEFLKGIEFVQKAAKISEDMNHHPFISIDYKMVTLKLTSWHARGLTELDFDLAKKFDELYVNVKK